MNLYQHFVLLNVCKHSDLHLKDKLFIFLTKRFNKKDKNDIEYSESYNFLLKTRHLLVSGYNINISTYLSVPNYHAQGLKKYENFLNYSWFKLQFY